MPSQLNVDCLYEIFKHLKEDKISLHSCLLINRSWCDVSVRILWRDIWSFKYILNRSDVLSRVLSTIITCLPNESKELLHKNGFLSTPTRKPPLFNYVSFCKVFSVCKIDRMIDHALEDQQITNSNKDLLWQEILKILWILHS